MFYSRSGQPTPQGPHVACGPRAILVRPASPPPRKKIIWINIMCTLTWVMDAACRNNHNSFSARCGKKVAHHRSTVNILQRLVGIPSDCYLMDQYYNAKQDWWWLMIYNYTKIYHGGSVFQQFMGLSRTWKGHGLSPSRGACWDLVSCAFPQFWI